VTIGRSRLVFRRGSEWLSHSNCMMPVIQASRPRTQALFERHLSDRPGDWRVSIVGSRESDGWEMKVLPNGFVADIHIGGERGGTPAFNGWGVLLRLLRAKIP
jgi:hypothetical protein